MRRFPSGMLVLACALAAMLGASTRVQATNSYGATVDDVLAARSAAQPPAAALRVLVFGTDLTIAKSYGYLLDDLGDGASMLIWNRDLAALAATPGVGRVTVDPTLSPDGAGGGKKTATTSGSGSYRSLVPDYPRVDGATSAWNDGLDGSGVGVAVIDSGVRALPDFGSRLVPVHVQGLGNE